MRTLTVSQASISGRDHVALRRSSQDAVLARCVGEGAFGVVSDGCGSAPHSEVGAALTVATLGRWLELGLRRGQGAEPAVRGALARLACALSATLGATMGRPCDGAEERRGFVRDHLLATAVGFCVTSVEVLVFCWGDGVVLVDDESWVVDQQDRPEYPAYQVLGLGRLPAAARVAQWPISFWRFRACDVRRVAVATDGFSAELLEQAPGMRSSALTRWMRIRAREGHFRDDASVAVVEVTS